MALDIRAAEEDTRHASVACRVPRAACRDERARRRRGARSLERSQSWGPMEAGGGAYTFSRRTTRTVTGPGGEAGARSEETTRAARAGHAGAPLVVEVHRSATGSGRELLGVARAVGGRGGAFVRERGPGGDPERVWERAPTGVDPGDFDREWDEAARAAGLLAVPLGPSAEALRLLPHQGGSRNALPRAPARPEEREAARLGRRVFEEHTRRLQEEARALREAGAGAGAVGGEAFPSQPEPQRAGSRSAGGDLAFRLAREEAAGLWGGR